MTSPLPRLVVVTDWSPGEARVFSALEAVAGVGAIAVQLRYPEANTRRLLEVGRRVAELCGRSGMPLFVNGRLDLALLLDAHLHLPANGPDVADVRPHLPADRWISVAVHDEAEADRARGADLALVSPVFGAGSKPGDMRAPLGPDGFERLARRLSCPAYALGGVTEATIDRLPRPWCRGVAVVSAVFAAPDPAAAARALLAGTG